MTNSPSKIALVATLWLAVAFIFSCTDSGGGEPIVSSSSVIGGEDTVESCNGVSYDPDVYRCEYGELIGKCKGVDYYPAYQQCVGRTIVDIVDGGSDLSSGGGLSSSSVVSGGGGLSSSSVVSSGGGLSSSSVVSSGDVSSSSIAGGGNIHGTYAVTVINGIGSGNFAAGSTVAIIANEPPTGQEFKNWTTTTPNAIFANANNTSTSFTMPANAVTVTANYEPIASLDPSFFYGEWTSIGGDGATLRWVFTATTANFYVGGSYYNTRSVSEWQPVSSIGADSAAFPSGFIILGTATSGNFGHNVRYFFARANDNNHMAAAETDVLYGNGITGNTSYLIFQRSGSYSGNDNGGGLSSTSTDCSRYQAEYNVRKAQVERCERNVQTALDAYRMASSGTSLSMAQTNLTRAENELRTAETNLASTERQAAAAGCSVY